jgi:hypothetical protein
MFRKFCFPFATAPSDGTGGGAGTGAGDQGKPAGDKAPAGNEGAGGAGGSAEAEKAPKGGEGKTQGDQADAGKPASKVPDKYELKIPEGGEQYLGPEDLTYFEGVARASEWSNEDAQAEIAEAVARAKAREEAAGAKLLADLKADKDYGGANLETTQRLANAAVDRVFPEGHRLRDSFLQTFNRKSVGNNLTYLAFLAEVGRMMGEDSPGATRGGHNRGGDQDKANKFYDHPTSKAVDGRT